MTTTRPAKGKYEVRAENLTVPARLLWYFRVDIGWRRYIIDPERTGSQLQGFVHNLERNHRFDMAPREDRRDFAGDPDAALAAIEDEHLHTERIFAKMLREERMHG